MGGILGIAAIGGTVWGLRIARLVCVARMQPIAQSCQSGGIGSVTGVFGRAGVGRILLDASTTRAGGIARIVGADRVSRIRCEGRSISIPRIRCEARIRRINLAQPDARLTQMGDVARLGYSEANV
jgi:hypothetical protein